MFSQLLFFPSNAGLSEIFMSADRNLCSQQILLARKLSPQDNWVLESTLRIHGILLDHTALLTAFLSPLLKCFTFYELLNEQI